MFRGRHARDTKHKTRVFSGVQPTGNLHLGNYLGAIKLRGAAGRPRLPLLRRRPARHHRVPGPGRAAPQHARGDGGLHRRRHRSDPHIVFNQSQVSGHAELAWIFNCVARIGWLNRMTQFKEKAGKDRENASVGLYVYPNLMAADILLYHATHVPVGEDQKQHLELARDIAQKFNNDFAKTIDRAGYPDGFFPLPEPLITGPATRVMSLRDGTKKMSKSDPSDHQPHQSDRRCRHHRQEDQQGQDRSRAAAVRGRRAGGAARSRQSRRHLRGACRDRQRAVSARLRRRRSSPTSRRRWPSSPPSKLAPIGDEMRRLLADPVEIDRILADGAKRAHAIADPILAKTKDIVGFIRS